MNSRTVYCNTSSVLKELDPGRNEEGMAFVVNNVGPHGRKPPHPKVLDCCVSCLALGHVCEDGVAGGYPGRLPRDGHSRMRLCWQVVGGARGLRGA